MNPTIRHNLGVILVGIILVILGIGAHLFGDGIEDRTGQEIFSILTVSFSGLGGLIVLIGLWKIAAWLMTSSPQSSAGVPNTPPPPED